MASSGRNCLGRYGNLETGISLLVIVAVVGGAVSVGTHYFGHPHWLAAIAGGLGAYLGMKVRRVIERRSQLDLGS